MQITIYRIHQSSCWHARCLVAETELFDISRCGFLVTQAEVAEPRMSKNKQTEKEGALISSLYHPFSFSKQLLLMCNPQTQLGPSGSWEGDIPLYEGGREENLASFFAPFTPQLCWQAAPRFSKVPASLEGRARSPQEWHKAAHWQAKRGNTQFVLVLLRWSFSPQMRTDL